jgi:allantoin racemase
MTKILFCEPVLEAKEPPPHWELWRKTVDLLANPGTTLDFGGLRKAYLGLSTYEQSYNGIQMAQRAYEAEKDGYDAFIIGCASDMGVRECRTLVNIPVVAPTEATAMVASTLGSRFSVIDLQPSTRSSIENALSISGMTEKLASIRCSPGSTVQKVFEMTFGGEQKKLAELFTAEMAKAVKEDKAEALFVSCTITSAFIASQGIREVEGAPVLDQFSVSLKLAEAMAALNKAYGTTVCRNSVYAAAAPGWEQQIPLST